MAKYVPKYNDIEMLEYLESKSPDEIGVTPQEYEDLLITHDPVRWAYTHLGWEARWYQERILRSPSMRKVIRSGRRVGKTETMVIHMLWYAQTHPGAVCLIATPYESQIKLIFRKVRQMMKGSEQIMASVTSDTKHPQFIEFSNDSIISGFTAGTKSGNEGASARGQEANWVYFDEIDYMGEKEVEAIYAIAIEDAENIGVWGSSTPTGKRETFWKWCMDARKGNKILKGPHGSGIHRGNTWTEFYFPSMVLPNWGPDQEDEFRATFSDEAYKHEVLAEFGEEAKGVFRKVDIDAARQDYDYTEHPQYHALRVIGVDWDKYGDATQIVVTEFNPVIRKFRVINRYEIPRSERTFDNAVKKIIELNKKYNPARIYCDRGYGEYQIEYLQRRGMEAKHDESDPAYGLQHKVHGVAFNENIEVRNPWTKQPEKKTVKPFMVDQTRILLERNMLHVSEHDDVIWSQMENYRVVRITPTGKPVYTDENEHALDALMLCVLCFTTEFPEVTKIIEDIEVARSIAFSKKKIGRSGDEIFNSTQKESSRHDYTPNRKQDMVKDYKQNKGLAVSRNDQTPGNRGSILPSWGKRGSKRGAFGRSRGRSKRSW